MEVARGAAIQQRVTFCVAREHSLNFSDQARITVTGLIDKARTLGGRKLDGGLENLADLAKFVRTRNTDRLRLVHRKIASLATSVSVQRIERRKEQHL